MLGRRQVRQEFQDFRLDFTEFLQVSNGWGGGVLRKVRKPLAQSAKPGESGIRFVELADSLGGFYEYIALSERFPKSHECVSVLETRSGRQSDQRRPRSLRVSAV